MKKGVAKQENRKAEGADQIVNELINNWEKECLPYWLPGMFYNSIYRKTTTPLGGGEKE